MTTSIDRRWRRVAITIALVVAAGTADTLRRGSSTTPDEAARGVDAGAETVASQRIRQLPAPPPRLPDVPRPREEERVLPEDWERTMRSAPAESVAMRMPAAGEEAPVRAHRFVPDQQPPTTQPPNPFVPPKRDLSEDELRAGLPDL